MISCVSVSPRRQHVGLYYRLHRDNIGQIEVCEFLTLVLRHLRGPVVVLLDNLNTHKGKAMRALLERQPRLHVEYFPPYAPELNPDEGVWRIAKRSLANSRPDNIEELVAQVADALGAIATSRTKLRACIDHSALPPFLR